MTTRAGKELTMFFESVSSWAVRSLRDLALNIGGFLLMFLAASLLGVGVRTGMEKLVGWGQPWLALVFVLVAAGVWATLLGLVRKKDLRTRRGRSCL